MRPVKCLLCTAFSLVGIVVAGTALSQQGTPQLQARAPGVPYVSNPYGGMFGSMGNVYSPYYRRFHGLGTAGDRAAAGVATATESQYVVNPYAGMYGSMGNVYSPYYRRLRPYGMGGASDRGPGYAPATHYHYPYFLPPTTGRR